MSSANFFSLLEDNTSSEPLEIARKKVQQQQQQQKVQPKQEVNKDAKEQPKQQQQQKPKEGAQQGEKSQQRPQTSQEQRGRGRGDRQQRPQSTTGGEGAQQRESRGRGRGRGERSQGDNENRPRRDNRPRVPREGGATGSPVDTTNVGGEYQERRSRPSGKSHTSDPNALPRRGRQFDRSVSGTGRGRGMKKGGEGAHNWGKEGDHDVRPGVRPFQDKKGRSEGKVVVKGEDTPLEGVTSPIKEEEKVETPTQEDAETKTEGEGKVDETADKAKTEEVDNTITLDEYQKQQEEKRKALLALRPESAPAATTTTTTAAAEKKKKKKKAAKVGGPVPIQEFLKDRVDLLNQARENEREQQRRGRGRGGARGSSRPKRQDAPNLKDTKAFPSLTGK
jgi:hypothetical protein